MFAFTRKDVDARVVGSALVVSFQGNDVQKTWRADMASVATAALELKEVDKKFSVVMRKGEAEEVIATFGDRESASYALSAITGAMLRGDTLAIAAQGGRAMAILSKLFKAGVIILLLMVLFNFLGPAILGKELFAKRQAMRAAMETPGSKIKPGDPIPADQLFGGK